MSMSMANGGKRMCAVQVPAEEADKAAVGNGIFFIAIVLTVIGFLFVVDTSLVFKGEFDSRRMLIQVIKQLGIVVIGWSAAFYLCKLDRRAMKAFGGSLMFVSLMLLIGVLIFGPRINGCKRWLQIGPLTIQPLEFFKVALVMQLAEFLSAKGSLNKLKPADIIRPILYVLLGVTLLFLQPNLSAVVFVSLICIVVAWIGGLPTRHIWYLAGFFSVVFIVMILIYPDRWERFVGIWNVQGNISDAGYQIAMALFAISRGGLFGVGLGQSIGKFSLPYNDSDFIFTIIVEETGLLGGIVLIVLFGYLIYLVLRLARAHRDNYPMLLCLGLGLMIATQALINIAVNIGFLPTTGMPLPFISAGGSNFIATLMAVGILLNLARGPVSEPEQPDEWPGYGGAG